MAQVTIDQAIQIAMEHHRAGRLTQAEALYRRVLEQSPEHADALHLLGVLACQLGRLDISIDLISRAVGLRPDFVEAHQNLATALHAAGRHNEAIAQCQKAVELRPASAELRSALAGMMASKGLLDEAVAVYQEALGLDADCAAALSGMADTLRAQGRVGPAISAYRAALSRQGDRHDIHSALLLSMHYDSAQSPEAIYQEHRAWNRQHAAALAPAEAVHANDPSPARRLRIGYVSPDLCDHVVARFLLGLLSCHDHAGFEIYCYAPLSREDEMTDRLRACAHQWRSLIGVSDEHAARLIRQDQVDILVDLAGHTPGNRLLVFARRPAPVQVTYLGYPDTTGVDGIDYRLSDPQADPPGLTEALASEQLLRLPRTAWCFHPVGYTRPVTPLPALARGYLTFGTFNNFAKVSDVSLDLWAQVMEQVPGSHLMLKGAGLGCESVVTRLRQLCDQRGIAASRLDLLPRDPSAHDHLRWYDGMDISLDTFPYHGTTTTCEAMWMGVPVVSLAGRTHVSRVGASLLGSVGLGELAAASPAEYVQAAVSLAQDSARLQELRRTLRQRMQASPLMDGPAFARDVEAAYRAIWARWCAGAQARRASGGAA